MSAFPVEVLLTRTGKTQKVNSPRELPSGEPFRVLKTSSDRNDRKPRHFKNEEFTKEE